MTRYEHKPKGVVLVLLFAACVALMVAAIVRADPDVPESPPAPAITSPTPTVPSVPSLIASPLVILVVPSGIADPRVSQKTIGDTICRVGWSASVRPPSSYTNRLKLQQLRAASYPDQDPSHYQEDHFIPLELGGAARDVDNLWPQPIIQARASDKTENALHRLVCQGKMELEEAQLRMGDQKRTLAVGGG